jgi:nucleoside phosphorylase
MPRTSLMMRVATLAEELVGERVVVGGHAVGRGDGAQRTDIVIGAPVAHHAHGLDRQQHGEGLPDRIIESGALDLLEIDRIGLVRLSG